MASSRGPSAVTLLLLAQVICTVRFSQALTLDDGSTCDVDLARGPKRGDFPPSFVFGAATSAFQVEGGVADGGRKPSIWDTFQNIPGKIADGSNADVTADSYDKFRIDVALLKMMGMQSYRFSISWSRILPDGSGLVNEAGIKYYSDLIDALVEAGMEPAVTLFHWDLPQALNDEYGGWLSKKSIDDFANYAAVCFERFGDRVKFWITINEPQIFSLFGYRDGVFAPGRCSDRTKCAEGNSTTEPYIVAKNLLMAHATAVKVYRTRYQAKQGGALGIALDCAYLFPRRKDNPEDIKAANDGLELTFGWFASAVLYGDYSEIAKQRYAPYIPPITAEESKLLRGSTDFLGLNLYTGYFADVNGVWDYDLDGNPVGEDSASPWLKINPESMYGMLTWIAKRYPGAPVYVTENGVSQLGDLPMKDALCDQQRVKYFQDYINAVSRARRDGAIVNGYFAWSLLDNFEWNSGYTQRFGIHYVDFADADRTRTRKASAFYWSGFMGLAV